MDYHLPSGGERPPGWTGSRTSQGATPTGGPVAPERSRDHRCGQPSRQQPEHQGLQGVRFRGPPGPRRLRCGRDPTPLSLRQAVRTAEGSRRQDSGAPGRNRRKPRGTDERLPGGYRAGPRSGQGSNHNRTDPGPPDRRPGTFAGPELPHRRVNTRLRLAVIGPGRAGGALAIAAMAAGHSVETVAGPSGVIPPELAATRVKQVGALSPCELLILGTPDDVIEETALRLAADPPAAGVAAHLSGFASIDRLDALERTGLEVGCLHPLQTLPSPQRGAAALAGSTAAVTARSDKAAALLCSFAQNLGMSTFRLEDRFKPLYHAAAATVALGVATTLGVAADLFAAAGVSFCQSRGLATRVLENCFEMGPDQALTGPMVRGDRGTIAGHLKAAEAVSPELAHQYRMLVRTAAHRNSHGGEASETISDRPAGRSGS
ncbi:MAG: DUF2520 domain-containing protein [Acidimicrobiia bacterium]|nr:DUF2520 domain-containing protein [Acidimicrobiia bacterium]MYB79652.1 DUF2520 domain-containing protein [Acidimicrobiia bacterium]